MFEDALELAYIKPKPDADLLKLMPKLPLSTICSSGFPETNLSVSSGANILHVVECRSVA